jgi:hypothetical protein
MTIKFIRIAKYPPFGLSIRKREEAAMHHNRIHPLQEFGSASTIAANTPSAGAFLVCPVVLP